jgi:glycosyltransferase involved in cell wall biosynthesis
MSTPIFSVAIATRDYGQYLPRALTSALRAGAVLGLPFEIVVVDDASTDDTREVLERFRLAHPECIKVVYRSTARGIAVAKNTALGHCSGRYIAILDADDEFHPEKLARCYACIAGGQADFVTHDFLHWRSPSDPCVMNRATWSAGTEYDFWPPSTWVFRTGLVRHNEQMIGGGDDTEWLSRHRGRLRRRHVERVLTTMYAHPDSSCRFNDSRVPGRQMAERIQGRSDPNDQRAPMIWRCGTCGRQLLLPAICCGQPAVPAPLLFYSVAESPLPMMPPEFSVVFLTENRVELTRRAVESLLIQVEHGGGRGVPSVAERPAPGTLPLAPWLQREEQQRPGPAGIELVFVDGGSADGTLAAVRNWAASVPVRWVSLTPEEPFSYSRSANRGARAATGSYLLFVNPGVEVCSKGLFGELRAALEDARVGVAGLSMAWNEAQGDPEWDTARASYVFTRRPLAGSFWATRREIYWGLGGLDENFTGYGYEGLDFQYRALRAHYRLALVAGRMAHHAAAPFRIGRGAAAMEQADQAMFARKHGRSLSVVDNCIQPFAGEEPPALSIVVVARDAGPALRRTLKGAATEPRCHDGSIQVVVVNNGSRDETGMVLAEYRRQLPRLLTVVELERPLETHQALDIGRARAIGRALLTQRPGERLQVEASE